MSEIEFETLSPVSVQEILEDRSVETSIRNLRGIVNDDGFELQGYDVESEDEIDLCDILNLSFDQPVICERRDVENSISVSEYETLKISDNRRGEEVRLLQEKLAAQVKQTSNMFKLVEVKQNSNMFKLVEVRDIELIERSERIAKLRAQVTQLLEINKPWYTKIPSLFSRD